MAHLLQLGHRLWILHHLLHLFARQSLAANDDMQRQMTPILRLLDC
jgi:hypothetical protein